MDRINQAIIELAQNKVLAEMFLRGDQLAYNRHYTAFRLYDETENGTVFTLSGPI